MPAGVLESTGKSLQSRIRGEIKADPPGAPALYEAALAIDSREKLVEFFERNPEPTPAELKQLLKIIKKVLQVLRFLASILQRQVDALSESPFACHAIPA